MNACPQKITGRGFILVIVLGVIALAAIGCGTVKDSSAEWATTPPVSVTARLEYRIDSLMNENRRLKQQLEAMAIENRNLTARAAELETRMKDAAQPKTPVVVPRAAVDVSSGYAGALGLYRKRDYNGAIQQFEALLSSGIEQGLQDNCHYWIGESYYGLRKFNDAISRFQTVIAGPLSNKKDDAQLMIGKSYAAQGNTTAAREAFNKLITDYPSSKYIRAAQAELARLK